GVLQITGFAPVTDELARPNSALLARSGARDHLLGAIVERGHMRRDFSDPCRSPINVFALAPINAKRDSASAASRRRKDEHPHKVKVAIIGRVSVHSNSPPIAGSGSGSGGNRSS